ncbi:MAG: hypothetical protein FWB93_01685 [Oscillospiraceae bacterium]|nr:hypothetical protein [Oscillospiraceae bacterium]
MKKTKRIRTLAALAVCLLLLGGVRIFSNADLFAHLGEAKEYQYGNMFQPAECCHIDYLSGGYD